MAWRGMACLEILGRCLPICRGCPPPPTKPLLSLCSEDTNLQISSCGLLTGLVLSPSPLLCLLVSLYSSRSKPSQTFSSSKGLPQSRDGRGHGGLLRMALETKHGAFFPRKLLYERKARWRRSFHVRKARSGLRQGFRLDNNSCLSTPRFLARSVYTLGIFQVIGISLTYLVTRLLVSSG